MHTEHKVDSVNMKDNTEEWNNSGKKSAKLIKQYEQMLEKNKTCYFDVNDFEDIIDFYYGNNKLNNAVRAARYALKLHPYSTEIRLKQAFVLSENNQPREAIQLLNKLGKIEPANVEVWLLKGNAYKIIGNTEKAIKCFNRAISISLKKKDDILYQIAILFEQSDQYDIAIQYLKQAYQTNYDNDFIIYELGYCYEKINENKKSVSYYKKFLDINPFSESAWYNLGIAYNKLEMYEKSVEAYNFAIAIDPEYSSAHYNKANTLANWGKYNEAVEVYHEFILFEEDNDLACCYIGECYEKMGDFTNAIEYYQKAIDINLELADAHYGVSIVLHHLKRYIESLFFIKKAIELDNANPDYWFLLGILNLQLDLQEKAMVAFKKTTELDPYDFEAWVNYSSVIYNKNEISSAIKILQDGYEYNPDNEDINYHLAGYYLKNHNLDSALFHLEHALHINHTKIKRFLNVYPEANYVYKLKILIAPYIKK